MYVYILPLHVSAYPGHSQGRSLFIIEGTKAFKLLASYTSQDKEIVPLRMVRIGLNM